MRLCGKFRVASHSARGLFLTGITRATFAQKGLCVYLAPSSRDFSLKNLRIINDAYKNYEMYWFEVSNSALCGALGALLDKEEKLRKSQKLALFFKGLFFRKNIEATAWILSLSYKS